MFPIETIRHSAAHIMAAAVRRLFPDAKFDIGPSTAEGFYYDFDLEHRLSKEDFPAIEAEMRKIIAANVPFERVEVSRDEAKALFAAQPYKLERLADIPEGDVITIYRNGDFTDLCRGPHVARTGDVGAIQLTSIAGSYYRGDEKNKMLQRVYGIAAPTQEEL
ncbi:MAG: threonine--tRNA ligase, partial [Kiritimatiellae bacterium]|nr:threonine--tRNA ligase [Kiritimatiellia bacterium]